MARRDFFGHNRFELDGVEFVSGAGVSSADRLFVLKTAVQIEELLAICRGYEGGAFVELGIASGGSTALLALAARPRCLVAIELASEPVVGLDELIRRRGLQSSVHPHYGVNQADRAMVARIVDRELGGDQLDLVVDDASHLLPETTASFEILFPRLRPGGTYIIEDWNSSHLFAEAVGATPVGGKPLPEPLSPLLVQLLLLRAESGDIVSRITIGDLWAAIERGPGELDPDGFRLSDHITDAFGLLASDA